MEHAIRIERVFNLGDYKSLRVVAETTGIPDEIWLASDQLAEIRSDLQSEIMASFALHMTTLQENIEEIKTGDYKQIYGKYS